MQKIDNVINDSLYNSENSSISLQKIINYVSSIREKYKLKISKIKLSEMKNWNFEDDFIAREDRNYFKVIGIEANIPNREKGYWQQPMIENLNIGICTLIGKYINNIFHIIVHTKFECGNIDNIELGPTIQLINTCSIDSDNKNDPYINYQNYLNQKRVLFSTIQSEEGGRFYNVSNKYSLILAEDNFNEELPEGYLWITLRQLTLLNKMDGYINIYLRNFLSFI